MVATGGFNSNLDMVLEFNPTLRNDKVLEGSGRGSTGAGHKLVRQAGGYLTHMDHIWFYVYATPDYRDPTQRRGLVFRLVPGYIWVNQQGRRFHNEAMSGGNSASPALLAQSPRHAWAIMDTPMKATMEVADPYYRDGDKVVRAKVNELLDNSPFIRKSDTLAGLAKKMEVDVPAFLGTVERYNKACAQKLARGAGVRQAARQVVEGVRHAALLRGEDLSAGAQELWRRQDRPPSAACSTSTSSRSPGSTRRARSPAWPVGTSTAAPVSKAPCWVRRCSADGSPAAGRRMRRATVAASSASRTGVEFGGDAAQNGRATRAARLLCMPTILMYPITFDACRRGWPPDEEQTHALEALDASFLLDRGAHRRVRMAHVSATSGGAGGQAQRGAAQPVLRSAICRAAQRRVRAGGNQDRGSRPPGAWRRRSRKW